MRKAEFLYRAVSFDGNLDFRSRDGPIGIGAVTGGDGAVIDHVRVFACFKHLAATQIVMVGFQEKSSVSNLAGLRVEVESSLFPRNDIAVRFNPESA